MKGTHHLQIEQYHLAKLKKKPLVFIGNLVYNLHLGSLIAKLELDGICPFADKTSVAIIKNILTIIVTISQ